ncbi:uncharacterized protein [Watersipora subatra]|uniref:uncharacterized protein n=1 Tax=Watersipora subatra TaxID=2589382 RepID=UPI00355BA637
MTHFSPKTSHYRREWVKDLPMKYRAEWQRLGLVKPPVKNDGTVVRSVPFYAAQQLHKLDKIPRQLRGATKPIVVTTSKIGEPEVTSEQRRYNLLRGAQRKCKNRSKKANMSIKKGSGSSLKISSKGSQVRQGSGDSSKISRRPSVIPEIDSEFDDRKYTPEEEEAATKIKATFKGYITRKKLAQAYKRNLKKEMKKKYGSQKVKIWEKSKHDVMSSCHMHSCTENLARQFVITDLPSMMKFLKDPVAQQAYRKNYLLRLMHTPCMDISGTMVKPLLKDEIKQHSSKFRWV